MCPEATSIFGRSPGMSVSYCNLQCADSRGAVTSALPGGAFHLQAVQFLQMASACLLLPHSMAFLWLTDANRVSLACLGNCTCSHSKSPLSLLRACVKGACSQESCFPQAAWAPLSTGAVLTCRRSESTINRCKQEGVCF